ncbi:zinc finger CCCH domain-containing protein [Klebsormidium nitens]|uniref:Zinc finger CCCH domain-containing protein n=1 Tax=Klebsormidium nitens TaxID=105231 RepID=A0A1Y1HRX3_KLENI|nr:zinc finger CCCH domain-containing protein [Klebsormidium nitens]|eukprot:GAQ79317.1 zinc finger CCCH domain-containing protein [Klebsormidium nitens]
MRVPHGREEMQRRNKNGHVDEGPVEMDLAAFLRSAGRGPSLLDLAAKDELAAFRYSVLEEGLDVDALYTWYGRRDGSDELLVDQRTPAMVAAEHGGVNVLSFILSSGPVDVNRRSRVDGRTALHFCVAGGSQRAAEAASMLLKAGADRSVKDLAFGRRPLDMIYSEDAQVRASLERQLLAPAPIREWTNVPAVAVDIPGSPLARAHANPVSPRHEYLSPEFAATERGSPLAPGPYEARRDHRGFVLDPTIPDVTSSVYMSDEFRMFSFKIKPCSRSYSHDWTDCPFAHPGEAARRRDPRQHPYSCLPCPDFRKGACAKGDACDFAHGVFESWLHPAQYRTRLCKDGPGCDRRVCFFAHLPEELRPLSSNWGHALPLSYASPMSPSPLEKQNQRQFSPPLPVSPSSVLLKQGPFSPGPGSPVAKQPSPPQAFLSPPRSPSENLDYFSLRAPQMIRPQHLSGEFRRELDLAYEEAMSPRVARGPLMSPHEVSREEEAARVRQLGDAYEARRLAAELGSLNLGGRARPLGPHHSPRFRPHSSTAPPVPPMRAASGEELFRTYDRPQSPQMPLERQVRNPRSPLGGAVGLPAVQGGPSGRAGGFGSPRSMSQENMVQNGLVLDSQRLAHSRFARSNTWQGQISDWGLPGGAPEWGAKREDVESARAKHHVGGEGREPDISWVQRMIEEEKI